MQININELLAVFMKTNTSESFENLSDGDVVNAEVVDVTEDNAAVKLPSGQVIKAKLSEGTDIEIGDKVEFTVKSSGGKTILKLSENSENTARKTLKSIGISPSKQNTQVMKTIIENSLNPDEETINKAAFFKLEGLSDAETAFMIKENFAANKESISILRDIKESGMTQIIKEFAELIADGRDSGIAEKEKKGTAQRQNPNVQRENSKSAKNNQKAIKSFIKKYAFDIEKDNPEQIKEKVKELAEMAKQEMKSEDIQTAKAAQRVYDTLKFMSEIDEYKAYIQFPVVNEDNVSDTQMFVFRNQKKAASNGSTTLLLCLDFDSIGHTDIFMEKSGNNIAFQFRLKDEHIISLFKNNIGSLKKLLPNYSISASFKKADEKFDITYDNTEKDEKRKYSFDMKA